MDSLSPKPYRQGNIPNAMRSAALEMLDEDGADSVGLREAARRIGVSATAAYRHFPSKEGLLASVAAEGFIELFVAMHAAKKGPDPLIGPALAYIEFAMRRRGLFRRRSAQSWSCGRNIRRLTQQRRPPSNSSSGQP